MKFDARVQGIPNHLADARKYLQRADLQMETAKFAAAEAELAAKLPRQKETVAAFFHRRHECVAHFLAERFTFMRPLHEFACFINGTTVEEVAQENSWIDALHTVLMGANDSLVVPFDFQVPLNVKVPDRKHPFAVCSGPRIVKELNALDEYVAIEQTLGIRQFDAFVSISNHDMERYEKHQGVGRRFWAKWGVAALRGLVSRAMEKGLPVIVDPLLGDYPAGTPTTNAPGQ